MCWPSSISIYARPRTREEVPGVVAVAANDNGVIYEGAFGKRDLAKGTDMTVNSVFWIASMTKALTATAAMQLVEQGKLQLDEPISKVLPDLAWRYWKDSMTRANRNCGRQAPDNAGHLLTHTAGFTYDFWDADTAKYVKFANLPGIISCKNAALQTPLAFDPGERWEYGINIDYAGKAVEAVGGQKFRRLSARAPLSTTRHEGYRLRYRSRSDGSAGQRACARPGRRTCSDRVRNSTEPEFFMGGGGLYGTARDYLAFLQMLMHGGEFNGARILRPETVAEMSKNNIGDVNISRVVLKTTAPTATPDIDMGQLFPGQDIKWGLSFLINPQQAAAGRQWRQPVLGRLG